ncbi:MAG: TadE family protein [Pirellulaceae bacterium]|nr:TadE family protein [Pirellulaceae bacterium]
MRSRYKSSKTKCGPNRRGSSIVEFAIMSPIIILIVFGTIDICSLYYLRQSGKLAAYEGCRIGLTTSGTDALVNNQATRVLNSRRITGYSITTIPPVADLTAGQLLNVRVTMPSSINLPLRGWLTGSSDVICEVKMPSEK